MKYKQILTELLPQIRLLKKSHDLVGLEKLLTDTETFLSQPRLKTVQVIKPVRRTAVQELQTRYPDGKLIPTTWRPADHAMPAPYFEDGVDTDDIWDEALKNLRPATSAEQETTIAANIKLLQQQPTIEAATDLGPEGIEIFCEQDDSEVFLDEVKIGKLDINKFIVESCPSDRSHEDYFFYDSYLNIYNEMGSDFASFWTEHVGEVFNPEISVKRNVLSYLEPGRVNLRILKPALSRIQNLPVECGSFFNNDRMKWFKLWTAKAVELYGDRAFIEFRSSLDDKRGY